MTEQELFDRIVKVLSQRLSGVADQALQNRLTAFKAAGPKGLDLAQGLITDTKFRVAGAQKTGACKYQVDNRDFCVSNVTQQECNTLGGTFGGECGDLPSWAGSLPK